jgi:hypothetical protein
MLPLKKLYIFVSHLLKRVGPNKQAKKKGRPRKYEDALRRCQLLVSTDWGG